MFNTMRPLYNYITYITFNTNLLHVVFINYCSDMFRPKFLAIFRELASLSSLDVNLLRYFVGSHSWVSLHYFSLMSFLMCVTPAVSILTRNRSKRLSVLLSRISLTFLKL